MLGLEEFDGITGWIVHYQLLAAPTLNDVAAQGYTCFLQSLGKRGKVRHFNPDPVPATGLGDSAVRHRLARPARTACGFSTITSRCPVRAGESSRMSAICASPPSGMRSFSTISART